MLWNSLFQHLKGKPHPHRCVTLTGMAGKAAQRAVAMMVTEAHMAAVCLHGSHGSHGSHVATPLSLTIPWLLEAPSSMAHPGLSSAPSGALMAPHMHHQQALPAHAKAAQSFWWRMLVRAVRASQHLGVSTKAPGEEEEESHEPLLSASPALESAPSAAALPPALPLPPAPPVSAALQEPPEQGPVATAAEDPAIQAPGAASEAAQSGQQHAGSAATAGGSDGSNGSNGSGGSDGFGGSSRGLWEHKRASGGHAVQLESPVSDACCSGVDQQPGGCCCVHAGTCCCHAACEEGFTESADIGDGASGKGKGKSHRTWCAVVSPHVVVSFVRPQAALWLLVAALDCGGT
ncbi:unnamed protein product [Closterium sp. NIES-54]